MASYHKIVMNSHLKEQCASHVEDKSMFFLGNSIFLILARENFLMKNVTCLAMFL